MRTDGRTFLFFFYSCRDRTNGWNFDEKEENLEKYHDREIKRDGRSAFPVSSIVKPGRKADSWAEKGAGCEKTDEIEREIVDRREKKREISIYKYKPSRQFQLLFVLSLAVPFASMSLIL